MSWKMALRLLRMVFWSLWMPNTMAKRSMESTLSSATMARPMWCPIRPMRMDIARWVNTCRPHHPLRSPSWRPWNTSGCIPTQFPRRSTKHPVRTEPKCDWKQKNWDKVKIYSQRKQNKSLRNRKQKSSNSSLHCFVYSGLELSWDPLFEEPLQHVCQNVC